MGAIVRGSGSILLKSYLARCSGWLLRGCVFTGGLWMFISLNRGCAGFYIAEMRLSARGEGCGAGKGLRDTRRKGSFCRVRAISSSGDLRRNLPFVRRRFMSTRLCNGQAADPPCPDPKVRLGSLEIEGPAWLRSANHRSHGSPTKTSATKISPPQAPLFLISWIQDLPQTRSAFHPSW